ncbi:uncharacterized protein N7496_003806 [Penicillium cataractarum]|uniref:Methyltransferase domain-containing protein n=1 Tax=Penicillium cataractarum TaxID=2100454 RepID=A0A9W9SMS5_9EURO|nr:uncharacterized protein N7496_003806 [Penicillium cataractarum]KAJ5381378.1 hypothetical protein N7496_003806 [Penicillium cataractarum]
MARNRPLPLSEEWEDPDTYIKELLNFATTNVLFMNLCGGVHMVDFLTREPDLYTSLLPEEWRAFFEAHDIHDILQLLLREDIESLRTNATNGHTGAGNRTWKDGAFPPQSILDYIHQVRRLSLRREFDSAGSKKTKLPRHVAVGMKTKKEHEVEHFSGYVASLSDTVGERRGEPVSHIVDFGSGRNYLGRTLASSPFHKHIIAIERKHQYIAGAMGIDVSAKLREREKSKTVYVHSRKKSCNDCNGTPEVASSDKAEAQSEMENLQAPENVPVQGETVDDQEDVTMFKMLGEITLEPHELLGSITKGGQKQKPEHEIDTGGTISYIEHNIQDGYLEPIIDHVVNPSPATTPSETDTDETNTSITIQPDEQQKSDARVMVVSLHSCGNLVHHGVRSLVMNPSVVAVAMIGCCYNLMTERLGPATYKLPVLRSLHPRLQATGNSYDPHGFPMSKYFETHESPGAIGMKFNITARMMAVQAPYNWGHDDSERFFARHYFRALLQRIFVDRGVTPKPGIPEDLYADDEGAEMTTAVIIGSLPKRAFESFTAYVRAATARLLRDPKHSAKVQEHIATMTDEEIQRYEADYFPAKKNLSVIWSLMAFSAQVVETVIVVDRWQFLREHDSVKECWVEPVFEYSESPRNLAVIGIKK